MTEEDRKAIEPIFNHACELRDTRPFEALRIFKQLDERFPDEPTITGMIGGIYHLLKDWSNALPWYQKTTARSPKSELASIGLFHCLWHHERFDEAFAEAKRFIQLNGMTEDYSLLIAELDEDGEFD